MKSCMGHIICGILPAIVFELSLQLSKTSASRYADRGYWYIYRVICREVACTCLLHALSQNELMFNLSDLYHWREDVFTIGMHVYMLMYLSIGALFACLSVVLDLTALSFKVQNHGPACANSHTME